MEKRERERERLSKNAQGAAGGQPNDAWESAMVLLLLPAADGIFP